MRELDLKDYIIVLLVLALGITVILLSVGCMTSGTMPEPEPLIIAKKGARFNEVAIPDGHVTIWQGLTVVCNSDGFYEEVGL